ncbi:hypothetical protein [Mycolicibacterium mucogenicum]|uniref:hypothetical protein n=1 Tax=Mycolicibacterium mucogenicum TaxID=56689 RepID=UPI00076A1144|nr:hypothetical protein [Mycolicibacterium mucogenicum]
MQAATIRLIVHATCFLTVFIGVVVLVGLDQIEPGDALPWLVPIAGLISPALSMAKLVQDRRSGDQTGEQGGGAGQ